MFFYKHTKITTRVSLIESTHVLILGANFLDIFIHRPSSSTMIHSTILIFHVGERERERVREREIKSERECASLSLRERGIVCCCKK